MRGERRVRGPMVAGIAGRSYVEPMLQLPRRASSLVGRLAGGIGALAITSAALAQAAPPQPGLTRTIPVWIGYAVLFILLGALISVSLMPSKRGHQD